MSDEKRSTCESPRALRIGASIGAKARTSCPASLALATTTAVSQAILLAVLA